jgi:two-component system chemotaxis sensor kinase CheA
LVKNRDDDDLMTLFLEEAADRVERLQELAASPFEDEAAWAQLRRELHALKGASRMMGLKTMAELCHQVEDLVDSETAGARDDLEHRMGDIRRNLEALSTDGVEVSGVPSDPDGTVRSGTDRRRRTRDEMRVAAEVIDDLAERGARLRVVAVAAEGLADRVFRLATLAERGVGERAPRQVLATLATSLRQVGMDLEGGQRVFRRLTNRQLDAILRLQVQPLKPFLRSLANHAHDLATSLGKEVDVSVNTGEAQLDRRIVDALREAFLHLIRNAVDHGAEGPAERERAGKPEAATISIEASTEGDRVRLSVADDGRGIDPGEVVEKAVGHSVIDEESAADLTEAEILQLVFRAGFSTRDEKTELSGRGIGLDAVAATVRSLGGDLWMVSKTGKGVRVTIEVPVARRGERVLVLGMGQHQVAIPASAVRAYRRITSEMVQEDEGGRSVKIGENEVAARFLSDLLGEPPSKDGVLVEMVSGGVVVALVADTVVGEEEVIVRALPGAAGAPAGVEGITLLSSGRPVTVLSLHRLGPLEEAVGMAEPAHGPRARPIQVLLVDDSDVTREMIRRLLEDAGIAVTGVGTAADALLVLDRQDVDCLVTDIQMPGMDGLALTRKLRENQRFADLPVVVISTLDRPRDRLAGLESGADAYLTKQGLDARELVALVMRVGGGR